MAGAGVAILIPVLRRPHRAEPVVASIRATTPDPHRILFIGSPDDHAEHEAVRATGADLLVLNVRPKAGDYARKINRGVRATDEPFVFLAADDLQFHPGWFEAATALMVGPVGVVGTNDLGNQRVIEGRHATHSLVSREYTTRGTIDDPGRLLHEGYPHEFVDDEFVQTAIKRGAYAHAHDSIVEHLHPHWGKAPTDDLYDAQATRMRIGRRLFQRRRRLWR